MGSGPVTISAQLEIPDGEIVERFVRASGAGGQNVNKVSTAVELRFDVANSPSLPEPLRARLLARRDRRMTGEGVLVIDAQRFRTRIAIARMRASGWRPSSSRAERAQAAQGHQADPRVETASSGRQTRARADQARSLIT